MNTINSTGTRVPLPVLNAPPTGHVIRGDAQLAAFRAALTGPHFFELLDQGGGRLLVQLPVGVGKTVWLAEAVRHARIARPGALVLVLAPAPRHPRRGRRAARRP